MEDPISHSPFKFLDSYNKADHDIFFGREREEEELYAKVSQGKLLLVYGASGTGKSSLINCGLANKFAESDWLPVHIRRGGNLLRSTFQQLEKETIVPAKRKGSDPEALRKLIGSVFLDHFKPIYLIYDQFEELFIFGDQEEWKAFIECVDYLMETDLDVHFIFVIRGEYLEFLSEFEELIPEFFDNRLRVEKMTRKNALKSISGPCQLHSIDLENGFEEKLLNNLSPDKVHIELTFLQVFLDRIYRSAYEASTDKEHIEFKKTQIEELGQIGDVLAEFVDEQLFRMEDSKAALMVLKGFVSLQGTKVQRTLEDLRKYTEDLGQSLSTVQIGSIVTQFVNKRILKDQDENGQFELRHDSLAQKIYEKITLQERELLDVRQFLQHSLSEFQKRKTLLNEEDLIYITSYERQLTLSPEMLEFILTSKRNSQKQKKARRTRSIIILVIVALMITSSAGFFYSQQQKERAERLAEEAQNQSAEALKQKNLAEEQREMAVESKNQAARQAEYARRERTRAEQASSEAQQARKLAVEQRNLALEQEAMANVARRTAEASQEEALIQKSIAERERAVASRLRMLTLSREIAVKATHLNDIELKALLSLQAFYFNQSNDGNPYQPDIYESLYSSRKSLYGDGFNEYALHKQAITGVSMSEEKIYTCGQDGSIQELEIASGKTRSLLSSEHVFQSLAVGADQQLFAGTQSGRLLSIDRTTGTIRFNQPIHSDDIVALEIQNGQIWSVSATQINQTGFDGKSLKSRIWPVELVGIVSLGTGQVLVGSSNGVVTVLNDQMETVREFQMTTKGRLHQLAINSDGNRLALGYENGNVVIYDLQEGQIEQMLPGHTSAITGLSFSQDNQFLASSSYDRTARIWRLDALQDQPIVLRDHDHWISDIAFGPDKLLTGSFSGTLKHFALNPESLTVNLCEKIGRTFSSEEWNEYIGEDIRVPKSCANE